MASPDAKPAHRADGDAAELTMAVVSARWNPSICAALTSGAVRAAGRRGARVVHATAPGAFELPFVARWLARSGDIDAIVVVGCVIRGETTHYELVSEGCAQGVMQVQLETGVPIGFGVVTVEDHGQALARSQGVGGHNVGEDAALAAIEMATLARAG